MFLHFVHLLLIYNNSMLLLNSIKLYFQWYFCRHHEQKKMIILRNFLSSLLILLCFLFYTEYYKKISGLPLVFNEERVEFDYTKFDGFSQSSTKSVNQITKKSPKNQTRKITTISSIFMYSRYAFNWRSRRKRTFLEKVS